MPSSLSFGTSFASRRWLSLNPTGAFCAAATLFLHLWAYKVSMSTLLSSTLWGGQDARTGDLRAQTLTEAGFMHCWRALATALSLASVASHLRCMLTDPGSVPVDAIPLSADFVRERGAHLLKRKGRNPPTDQEVEDALNGACGKCGGVYKVSIEKEREKESLKARPPLPN